MLEELKRRSVVRVGIAYLAVSWFVLQVIETLVSLGVVDEWLGKYAFYALLIGLPLALILSWYYELTPDGIRPDGQRDEARPPAPFGRRRVDLIIIAALSMVVVLLVIDNYILDSATPEATDREGISIAVIPFENRSTDPEQQAFVDGLTDELLNSLAGISDLRVISRNSSFVFRDANVPISEIAASLGVDHVLQGSVRKSGNTIRVTARLTDARADSQIWSDTYDRELTVENLLDIQHEVSVTVANALHAEFQPGEIESLRVEGPANLEALDRYHDGWYYLRLMQTGQGDENTSLQAIEKFEASIAADPGWAPSHAALATVYHLRMEHGFRDEDRRLARLHVMRAIELDDQYAPAYASLAYLDHMAGDFTGADAAYKRVRALGGDASWGSAIFATSAGRYEEAIREYRRAIALDPLAVPIRFQLAYVYRCAGRYDEAIAEFEKLQAEFPGAMQSYDLAYMYARTGQPQRALELLHEFEAAVNTTMGPQNIVYALTGTPERALAALADDEIQTYDIARMAAMAVAVGNTELALTLLEQESEEAVPYNLLFMQCHEELRSLAGNPRYEKLLDKVGFPD